MSLAPTAADPRISHKAERAAGILLLRLTVVALLLAGLARSWADPDLWGHVRFGGDILRGGLPRADPYSFTSDIPWTNHEWLAEVLMYLAWAAAGNGGLVILKLAIVLVALGLATAAIRRVPAPPVGDLLVFAALVGLWPRVFVIRPQLFSVALFAALVWILASAEGGRPGRLWLLPIVFAAWVNLHGGWLVGMGVLLLWAAVSATRFAAAPVPRSTLTGSAAAALAATLVNPYGLGLWSFLLETVRPDRPNINDWRPLAETGAQVLVPWLIAAGLTVAALARSRLRIPLAHLLIVVGLAVASVRVSRLDVFFTLSAVMLFGRYLGGAAGMPRPAWTGRTIGAGAALALVLIIAVSRAAPRLACLQLDGPWMPERESGAFIAANRLQGRLLTWFDWGQYAIWHFAPRLKVSLDGRRETVYSDAFVARHLRLYFQPDSEIPLLDALRPDYAWLPRTVPLVSTLQRLGWQSIYTGPVSIVLARAPISATAVPEVSPRACFPGP